MESCLMGDSISVLQDEEIPDILHNNVNTFNTAELYILKNGYESISCMCFCHTYMHKRPKKFILDYPYSLNLAMEPQDAKKPQTLKNLEAL